MAPRRSFATILDRLEAQHPNAWTELHFTNPYELLVATILSAQCTDARVNQVTPGLFARYPSPAALAAATTDELEPLVQPTGFFRAKSRSLLAMAQAVVQKHGGEIPQDMAELTSLKGVGRKTAACVQIFTWGHPEIPVDVHVYRVGGRLGLFPEKASFELAHDEMLAVTDPADAYELHMNLIRHGREICRPKPRCGECGLRRMCPWYRRNRPPRVSIRAPR